MKVLKYLCLLIIPLYLFPYTGYISNYGFNSLDIIDTASNLLKSRYQLPISGAGPSGFTFSKDLSLIFVANTAIPGSVYVLEAKTGKLLNTISTGKKPYDVILSKNQRLFVSNSAEKSISVFNANDPSYPLIATINVGNDPEIMILDHQEKFLYVVNASSEDVSVIDLSAYKEIKRIYVGKNPRNIILNPKKNIAYVCVTQASGKICVLDLDTNTIISTIEPLTEPAGMAISKNGQKAFVVEYSTTQSGQISVINLKTLKIEKKSVAVVNVPFSLALTPNEKLLYVCSGVSDGLISVLSTSTLQPISGSTTTFAIGGQLLFIQFPEPPSLQKAVKLPNRVVFQKGLL